jgi:hypothetical protein
LQDRFRVRAINKNLNTGVYDLVLVPSDSYDVRDFIWIENFKVKGCKTVLSIENWDNLTSKNQLMCHPHFIFSVGQDCKHHALKMHDFPPVKVLPAGLPRFEPFRLRKQASPKSQSVATKTIAYFGCSVPHNEIDVILELAAKLHKDAQNPWKLIYRPHPHRQKRLYEKCADELANFGASIVVEDRSINTGLLPTINQDHIDYLEQFSLVIATPTSMMLEAMILKIPLIIDATDDGIHRTTARKAWESYTHFETLRNCNSLKVALTSAELANLANKALRRPREFTKYHYDEIINVKPGAQYSDFLQPLFTD